MADGPTRSGERITLRDFGKTFNRATDELHTFLLKQFRAHVLDVEDVHFHFDSAVLMPDFGDCGADVDPADRNRITGLAVIRAVYKHAEAHADQKMLIAGHTDREGRDSYNLTLSRLRAENVLAVLEGNSTAWVDICGQKHKVEDYQQILKWVDVIWAWGCDPGDVDNILGPKTREATRVFQERYNTGTPHLPEGFTADISVDGIVGPQTWGAFFRVYMRVMQFILEVTETDLAAKQQALRFVNSSQRTVGCGENHPITANPVLDRSATREERMEVRRLARVDRRVEILFFEPGEEPVMDCHPDARRCRRDVCEIYDQQAFRLDPLPCEPVPPPRLVFKWEIDCFYHAPANAGPAQVSVEPSPSGAALTESTALASTDLKIVVVDDRAMPDGDLGLLGGAGNVSKLSRYQALGWRDGITGRMPIRIRVRRKGSDGSFHSITAGQGHVEIEIEDPPVSLSDVNDAGVRTFVQASHDANKDAGTGADNAIIHVDGRRDRQRPHGLDSMFASYDGNDVATAASVAPEAGGQKIKISLPASTLIDANQQSEIDLLFLPALQVGDNYKFAFRVAEQPDAKCETGTWTHLKRIHVDAMILVGTPRTLGLNQAIATYRECGVDLVPPTAAQTGTLSAARFRTISMQYFTGRGIATTNAQYQHGTFMFPTHNLGGGTPNQIKARIRTHRRNLFRLFIQEVQASLPASQGLVIIYGPQIHQGWSSLNGFYMGNKQFALFDHGQPLGELQGTFAHEMGHALYLRHSYAGAARNRYLRNSAGNLIRKSGARILLDSSSHSDDHDPGYGARCLMSYTRDRSVHHFCGMCSVILRFWNKVAVLTDANLKRMLDRQWGSLLIVRRANLAAPPAQVGSGSGVLAVRLLSAEETSGGNKFRKELTNKANWASSNNSVATIAGNGRVQPVAAGSTVIEAAIGNHKASYNLQVT